MGLLGAIGFSIALVSLTQIPRSAEGCNIVSAEASGPSSILVKWESHPRATNYFLDLRVTNSTSSAPVVVGMRRNQLQRNIMGLRPGTEYSVTLKVFEFYFVSCQTTIMATTVPAEAQIVTGHAMSSTSITVQWTEVASANHYFLMVHSQATGQVLNITSTNHTAVVRNLRPSTNYDCYVYSANQAGAGGRSRVRTITTLLDPPVNVSATQTGPGTARVTWQPVEDVILYRVVVRDMEDPTAPPASYNSTDTKLDIAVVPCNTYLISVYSYNNFLVPSEARDYTYTTNKLNPVSSVGAVYSCATHSAVVSWSTVLGASSYRAMATGSDGARLNCTGSGTSCELAGLACDQVYDVHVTPMSESCRHMINTTSTTFQTVPCPPSNLTLTRQCSSNVIAFSWNHTSNTDHYLATATDSKGDVQRCLTEDNSCYFTNTKCGLLYSFTVNSHSGSCTSGVSSTVEIRTAPCMPENLQMSSDCGTHLLSKWDLSEGAVGYTVRASGNRGNHSHYNCSTVSNSCAMEDVHCGDFLTTYITAYDDECSSPTKLGPVANTGPCPPHDVTAVKDCGADSIRLTWATTGSAIFYMGFAKDSQGGVHSCLSLDLFCTIEGLRCGTNYTAYVIASNVDCNSTASEAVTVETAACPPDQVDATLDCWANEAVVSWRGHDRLSSYTAAILDEDRGLLSCSSANTSCRIPSLKCGRRYELTVRYHDGVCPGLPSDPLFLDSVPCGPDVAADFDCQSRQVTLSWNASTRAADLYRAELEYSNISSSHSATHSPLVVDMQACGLDHTLTVRSVNGSCASRPTVLPVWKTPCVPTGVAATASCGQSSVRVAWAASGGAVSYRVTGEDHYGGRVQCSSAGGTSCRLEGTTCSQTYSVQVAAVGDNCTSDPSTAQILRTVPCPPAQFNATVDCAGDSALLSWSSSPNAVSYTGRAESEDGHTVSCAAGGNLTCRLVGLDCGKEYNFSVSASDGRCHSAQSQAVTLSTAPCAVENVLNALNCSSNTLDVSWTPASSSSSSPSVTIRDYRAVAMLGNGSALSCSATGSSCTMALQCGQQYTVTVRAVSSTCQGHSSEPEIVNSVPCVPMNVDGHLECSNNTLQVSWNQAAGAASYISTLEEVGGASSWRSTTDHGCMFLDLPCAETFYFSVVAANDRCNSSQSAIISTKTAPCDPTAVSAALNCSSGVVTVTWAQSAGAEYYTVQAEANGHMDTCDSMDSSCQLTQLRCGEDYTVTVLAGDGTCNSSMLAKTNVTTAPCAPTVLDHSLDCLTNHASVTWAEDRDALSVTVSAASNLRHSTSCSSSSPANSSCVLDGLQCGHVYTARAVAQGPQCASKESAPFQIVTAPCTPANVESTYSCTTGIVFLSWDETLGRSSFYGRASSGDSVFSCSVGQTSCSLPALRCGRLYNVTVTAVAGHCNSSVPGVSTIQTAPCAPENITSTLLCENNTAAVSWSHSAGAVRYTVKAQARDGDIRTYATNATGLRIPNMHCAQTYLIYVVPHSERCEGLVNSPISYIAGPCPPTRVDVSLQCVGNVGHVSWTPALYSDMYLATAVRGGGTVGEPAANCSTNGTGCSLAGLGCGETTQVTVRTVERGCVSPPSVPFTFQSVICPPNNVSGVTTCATNDISVSWQPSPESGARYTVRSLQAGGASSNASTPGTSHTLTGLQCGHMYTLWVAARDDQCTSVPSPPVHAETAPCPPTNLTATADCGTNLGTLTWAPSAYATYYTATLTGTHGHVASCSSNSTSCSAKLDCGRQYTALVVAGGTCNSSTGATLTFDSAPCLPDQVVADLDCDANSFEVRWRGSVGDFGAYTAIAIGSDGSRATCNSSVTNCTIHGVRCGLNYSIVVTTPEVDCGTIQGSDYMIQSAPCKLDSVSVELQCSTDVALVSWGNSGPDQSQEVRAVNNRGGATTTCTSRSSNCTFDTLVCGQSYSVSVTGHTEQCSSQPALAETLHTAPCVPTHLMASVDCDTGITAVQWDSASGATSYTVHARGSLGHHATCNNTDTNCNFPNLACGQDYNITVMARHDSCVSALSESVIATTGPCPHSGLKASLDCDTNTAVVSWTPGSGILYYNATASNSGHEQFCVTNGSSCNVSSLLCGKDYQVRVWGQGKDCPSPWRSFHRIKTAPCPPTQLTVASQCESNNISVSWQPSLGSFSYRAVAENARGQRWSCNTTSTSCQISSLPCGQTLQVFAAGIDTYCMGAKSNIQEIRTAPCVPHDVQTELHCVSGVLNVTWQSTDHVVGFRTLVSSSLGDVSVCETTGHHCVVPSMQCGLTYDVTVVAQDEACNSSQSSTKQLQTAPCPLPTFAPSLNCGTGVLSVAWTGSVAGVEYTVSAVDLTGHTHTCMETSGGCLLSALACGTQYNVTITPSRNGCVGTDSPMQTITTVPCVPTLSEVEVDCLTNSAWLMYNESAGAQGYAVMSTDGRGAVQSFQCNSTDEEGVCTLPPLACSQNLSFTIQAFDQQCSSAPSNAISTETAPCPPEDITRTVDCDNHTLSIGWSAVPGAVSYTATLEQGQQGQQGHSHCCSSAHTGCDISDVPCGEFYFLVVVAEGRTCNSSESERVVVKSVPCIPQSLGVSLSCASNVASMSWQHSSGSPAYYQVTALGADGHTDQCNSLENRCDLTDLHCGEEYTASVVAQDMLCKSKPSDSVTIKTVPCTPENVTSEVDCETDTLVTWWSDSPGADSYLATVQDSNGQTTTCLGTTEGSCNVTGLACGNIYHVSVVSSDGACDSPPSPVVDTPSAPCLPRHIETEMDCLRGVAQVTWLPSDGAEAYVVTASSGGAGPSVTCQSNSTLCVLDELLCGRSYSVSVRAVGQSCSSDAHMTGQLVTEPCVPEHISAQYSTMIAQVLWDSAPGADSYSVEGLTETGLRLHCLTNDTTCAMSNVACGQVYNISVTANNRVCQGVATSDGAVTLVSEPCRPSNVQASVDCQSDMGTVSWEPSDGAVAYVAHLAGFDGHFLSCVTNQTSCDVRGLHCGTRYVTTVVAVGETLNSSASNADVLVSAPCVARSALATFDCSNDTAEVSWSLAVGASRYLVSAVSREGHRASCGTSGHWCNLTELQCGQTYDVSLTTVSDQCQIETRTNASFSTRPCEPLYVGVDLTCGTSRAELYWEQEDDVDLYVATATSGAGTTMQRNSYNSTCQFNKLRCGQTYQFSVTAHSHTCYSDNSSTVEIQTEPCQPTNLTVSGSCDSGTVVLDWSAADGALAYVVTASGDLGYQTAFRTNDTTIEAELPCGQLFTFTVKAQDNRCDSAVSQPVEFKTGPCVPLHVESFTRCEDSYGAVSWARSDGAEFYMAFAVGQDGQSHMCTTNGTVCTWDDLHCGETYDVHVVADDNLCVSKPSNSTTIRMAPCIPDNLISSLNCSTRVGSLSWNTSETAEFYIVTAQSSSGHKLQTSTNDTWTYISEFLCGQNYFLSVQAVDSECTSRPSQPSEVQSEPCQPTGVLSAMNCVSNIAVVTWNPSEGAEFYTATVTRESGQVSTCMADGDQCGMPNLACGQNYTVDVVASNNCESDRSEEGWLQSVPCVPSGVSVAMQCSVNQAVVSWAPSPGALSYKVTAQRTQDGVQSFCESTGLTCTLTNLTCGQAYFAQVVALDDICSSLPSTAVDFNSVPCTPDMSSVVLDCFTNSALSEWSWAAGAVNYTATARSSGGGVSTCTSNYTNCELPGLACGRTYDVTAVASNDVCSSPPSNSLQLDSVPCAPVLDVPVLDCSNNTALVQWQASAGAESYIVQAFGVEEHATGCESNSSSCVLDDLLCGFTYNISVIAVNSFCNVSQSVMRQLQAVPCVPQHVQARVDCGSGDVAVSWEPSKGAWSYSTVAQGSGGYGSTCNSSQPTCRFSDLLCGHNYSITVSASDDTCSSAGSSAVDINTVPCVPSNVRAQIECSDDTGLVSWEEGEGVSSYLVRAFGPDGHKTQCTAGSTDTNCSLPMMHCGQLYNLTVTARDDRCDNSNAYLNLQSVPCSPTHVQASLQCQSNSAAVTWERASGALSYLAVGVSEDGSHRAQCNNTVTYCDLTDLRCGQTYNVSAHGEDESCSSVESKTAYMRTAPCPPQGVSVVSECAQGAVVVSWDANPDAQYFHVSAVSDAAARLSCNSTGTSCSIGGLPCGQSYSVSVISVRDGCESEPSAVLQTSSAPCVPGNATGYLDCVSNDIWVDFQLSEGAVSYLVVARGVGAHNTTCHYPPCGLEDLKCGTVYTIHVNAVNDHCYSQNSATFEMETGPCALTAVDAVVNCDSDMIHVEWEPMENSPLYVVTAEGHDRTFTYCNTSSNSCDLSGISCGTHYSIIVATSSDKCNSLRSQPRKIATAPCVPDNVTAVPSCEENGATVTWGPSSVANSYQLTARAGDGHQASCSPQVNNCTLVGLHCGQLYSLSLTASGDNCTSQPRNSSFRTVPCEPTSLSVDMDCWNNSASLSWASSDGAVEYYGFARSEDGDELHCDSPLSSCTIQGLQCGDTYNFTVEASNGICNSSFSAPVKAGAVPCAPTGLKVRMQKIDGTQWAMASWDRLTCPDVEYLVEISGRILDDPEALMEVSSYWWPREYFEFLMPCSTAYNLTVTSRNPAGTSDDASVVTGVTVPCAPQNAKSTVSRFTTTVSWDASVFATGYIVYNVSGGARDVELCNTQGLTCQVTNFDPETSELVAINTEGESNPSKIVAIGNRRRRDLLLGSQLNTEFDKGLEVPAVLNVTVSGVSVYVKWSTVKDAAVYRLVFEEESSPTQPTVRTVQGDFYIETDLKPWTTYCIRLAASNTFNQSDYSGPVCRTTGAS